MNKRKAVENKKKLVKEGIGEGLGVGKTHQSKRRGGVRKGAGRPPKVIERKILERLDPLKTKAYNALKRGLETDQPWAVKMFFEYYYGKAKESKDIKIISEQPLFSLGELDKEVDNVIDIDSEIL